jgi:KDO2-lipid IV(A) lauroyltransferase
MGSFFDRFVVIGCKILARMPFRIIYGLSDIFFVLLFYVVRYRRKVVHMNLINSFPEKSIQEINQITREFYRHLCDLGLETIKFSQMTIEELEDRFKIHNLDIYDEYYKQGKSIILLGMHHNNWEWSGFMQRYIKAQYLVVYNPVRNNKKLERFILDSRERFGAKSIAVNLSVRTALEFNKNERPGALVLGADQTPPANSQFWTTFLNQETAFFTGPMKIAIKTNQPVVLHHTRKVGRGRYEVYHHKLVENPSLVEPEDIMMAYIEKLEEIIEAEPEYWLWSHRRWKHQRPENMPIHARRTENMRS